jgi:hypothetical protein
MTCLNIDWFVFVFTCVWGCQKIPRRGGKVHLLVDRLKIYASYGPRIVYITWQIFDTTWKPLFANILEKKTSKGSQKWRFRCVLRKFRSRLEVKKTVNSCIFVFAIGVWYILPPWSMYIYTYFKKDFRAESNNTSQQITSVFYDLFII